MKRILRNQQGNATPLTIALVLSMLLVICTVAEFFRLSIIIGGVRDGLQQAVISTVTANYDEVYSGLREGYSGGYYLAGDRWVEQLDYGDIYADLDDLLGTVKNGNYHVKMQAEGYEYRLSELSMDLSHPQLAPVSGNETLLADVRIVMEVPLSFGWSALPPLKLTIRTQAEWMPKF